MKKISAVVLFCLLCTCGALAQERSCDTVLLKRFMRAVHLLDFNRTECTYRGTIDMNDPNDNRNNVRQLPFLFARSDSAYYYRLGNAEIIHRPGKNLFVQNDQQRVVLSNHVIRVKPPTGDLQLIGKALRSEHYALHRKLEGHAEVLLLVNERHISCKELSITLDTVSHRLLRIYIRLTCLDDPLNRDKDRTIDVHLDEMLDNADMHLYPSPGDVVRQAKGQWQLREKYKNYGLIQL